MPEVSVSSKSKPHKKIPAPNTLELHTVEREGKSQRNSEEKDEVKSELSEDADQDSSSDTPSTERDYRKDGAGNRLDSTVVATCLVLLTLIATGFAMYFAKSIILPILFAFLLNFFFSPLILKMKRFGVPPFVGAFLLMLGSVAVFATLTFMAYEPAKQWIKDAPTTMSRVEERLRTLRQPINELKETSRKLDAIVSGDGSESNNSNESSPTDKAAKAKANSSASWFGFDYFYGSDSSESTGWHVEQAKAELKDELSVDRPVAVAVQQPSLTGVILDTTGNASVGISLSIIILFFLLAAGDRGLEKMVELMPTWRDKRNVVQLTRNIQNSISRYMVTTTMINTGLGIVIGVGLWLVGVPNPVLWGVMAAFLNFLPFVGAIIGAIIVFLVAVVSFDSMTYALLAPGIYLGVNLIEANFITPTLLGRSISLHPVWLMVFFAFIGWMWGVAGAVIAVPMLAVIKITCDHIPPLTPVGKFLGR